MKRSTTTSLGLALAAVLTLSACGGGGSTDGGPAEEGGESSWTIPAEDPTAEINVVGILDPEADGMADVVAAFEADHPTIDVNYQFVPFDNLNSVLDSRITSKTGDPDLFWVDQPRVPALAARGYLEDLTPQFSEGTSALQEATVAASSYQDKLWSLPVSNSTQLLFYNKDLLDAAGVEPPSTDPAARTTWQQLKEDAATVQAEGDADNGLLLGQPNRYYQLEPLPVSAGGGIGATGEDNLTPDVANEGWVESMAYYGSLFEEGIVPRGVPAEQTDATFLAGDTAYMVQGNWMVGKLAESDLNWGAALNPVWEGGEPATPNGSWSVGMNPFSQNKEAAAIFLQWLALEGESGYAEHRAYAELPANLQGLESYLASDIFTSSEGGQQAAEVVAFETANTSVPRVSTVGYIEFEEIIGRAFSDIANGSDPQSALDGAQQELTNAWQQYQ
ncbi:sugar ABC transporter substrate-binding protein [Auraticoccus monumenti]|uniref:Carbohydrate ABC transporter substrate-binding protein, CUT1 family n=1 Tax=Auraticoccus monumenti TaxID=675864 RepID=A0A1G6T7Y3_9ACTN|nr:sugar ABC transporter substrate-binding protein [Auraticoccus monumenti]SDD24465.1 carbohydrate ABC transporter substrate-binding protein, CUT1 family [Auraticoccus monumenti]